MELSDKVIAGIRDAAKRVSGYGSLTVRFAGEDVIYIEVSDKIRIQEKIEPRAGEATKVKRVVSIGQQRQG